MPKSPTHAYSTSNLTGVSCDSVTTKTATSPSVTASCSLDIESVRSSVAPVPGSDYWLSLSLVVAITCTRYSVSTVSPSMVMLVLLLPVCCSDHSDPRDWPVSHAVAGDWQLAAWFGPFGSD